jgi:hypothetical protein
MAAGLLLVGSPREARAQLYESVGIRAQGMAGAFVAVADDATATWWNPAGLARGGFFSAVVEFETNREPASDRDAGGHAQPAWQESTGGIAVAFPALGVSYYRLRVSEMRTSSTTGSNPVDRLDLGPGDVRLRTLAVHQFGATIAESLGDHITIGSTLKLLHGGVGSAIATDATASLDRAGELDGGGQTHGDLDVGVLASWGMARVGASVKNVTAPVFGSGVDAWTLDRQARVGLALATDRSNTVSAVTAAVDADLTRTSTAAGDIRHLSAGVEVLSGGRRYGVRAGATVNTIGDLRPSASAGGTVRLRPGFFADVAGTIGSDKALRGFGVSARVAF